MVKIGDFIQERKLNIWVKEDLNWYDISTKIWKTKHGQFTSQSGRKVVELGEIQGIKVMKLSSCSSDFWVRCFFNKCSLNSLRI